MRNRPIVLGLVIALRGLFSTAERAEAAVLCTTKSSVVVVRPTTCKRKERPLNLADFGAQGPAGAPGPPGAKGDPGTIDTADFYTKAQSDSQFLATAGTAADANLLDGLDSAAFVRGNGEVRSARTDLSSGANTPLFIVPGVGQLDVSCSGTTQLTNTITYRNLSAVNQSWTRETVDQGNSLIILGGDVGPGATATYASGANVTDYSFHYRHTVQPPAGFPGTTVTYDVTGMIFPNGVARCVTHGIAIITP